MGLQNSVLLIHYPPTLHQTGMGNPLAFVYGDYNTTVADTKAGIGVQSSPRARSNL